MGAPGSGRGQRPPEPPPEAGRAFRNRADTVRFCAGAPIIGRKRASSDASGSQRCGSIQGAPIMVTVAS